MGRKITWMCFLIFGSSIIIFFSTSCKKKDYQVKANWIYINETGHNITFRPDSWSNFNVKPYDTTFYFQNGDGGNDITEMSYVSPLNAEVIYYDNFKCDTLKQGIKPNLGDGPLGMANYVSKKLGERYYEFTYRFTEKQYADAKTCK